MSDEEADVECQTDALSEVEELALQPNPTFRIHLSASRLAAWLHMETDRRNASRVALVANWHAPWPAPRRAPTTRTNPRTKWGNNNEQNGIDAYLAFTGIDAADVSNASFVEHPKHPWLGAAPDAFLGTNGLLEVKCPYRLRNDPNLHVILQDKWILQVWMQLECTGREWCDVCVWADEYLWIWRVVRQSNFLAADTPCLWDVLLPHFLRYPKLLIADDKTRDPLPMSQKDCQIIRVAIAQLRQTCVRQIAVQQRGPTVAWAVPETRRNDPLVCDTIDRVSNAVCPRKSLDGRVATSSWFNVRYSDSSMTTYTTSSIDESGGLVHSSYYTLDEPTIPRGNNAWGVQSTTTATTAATSTSTPKRPREEAEASLA